MSWLTPYAEKFSVALRNSIQSPYLLESSLKNVAPLAVQSVLWKCGGVDDCFVAMLVLLSSFTEWPMGKHEGELLIASTGGGRCCAVLVPSPAACQAIVCSSPFHR